MSKVLTGALHPNNRKAISWGWQDIVAFGCQSWVILVHPTSVTRLLTLKGHKSVVNQVCWQTGSNNLLCSCDTSGLIIVWDTVSAVNLISFRDVACKQISEIKWIDWEEWNGNYVLSLHPPYNLILWNVDTGEKVWKKGYTDALVYYCIDPFHSNRIAMVTNSGNILLVYDLNKSQAPSSNGLLFTISDQTSTMEPTGLQQSGSGNDVKRSSSVLTDSAKFIRKPFVRILQSTNREQKDQPETDDTECTVSDCSYHPAMRDVLIIVHAYNVELIDLVSQQTVSIIYLDRSASPFVQVLPSYQHDALYLLQENGILSFRVKKFSNNHLGEEKKVDVSKVTEVNYESECFSESFRITKSCRIFGCSLSPGSNKSLCLLSSNGKMMIYDLVAQKCNEEFVTLCDMLAAKKDSENEMKLRFSLNGYLTCIGANPQVVRARQLRLDEMSDRDRNPYKDLLAVGTNEGSIQLIDTDSYRIIKDIQVHAAPVRCVEWGGSNVLISSGHSQTLSTSGVVRNELHSLNINTGQIRVVRPEADESPITMLRVSYHHCYLAVAFRDQPLEIWHLKSYRLLRRMTKSCPTIMDLAWSGKQTNNNKESNHKELTNERSTDVLKTSTSTNVDKKIYRENLVVLDNEDRLYHVVVKGMHVRDGKEVNTQWTTTSHMNCMTWKDHFLAFGDGEGKLSVWNLDLKQSKASQSQRGSVKRLQFSSTYKDYTLLILHNDGLSTWDADNFKILGQLFSPRDVARVLDCDIVANLKLTAVLTEDGCVTFYDYHLECITSRIQENTIQNVFCPSLLPPNVAECFESLVIDPRLKMSSIRESLSHYLQCEEHILMRQVQAAEILVCRKGKGIADESDVDLVLRDKSTIEKAELGSLFLGDAWGYKFWAAVDVKLNPESAEKYPFLDLFWSQDNFKELQMLRASCVEISRASSEQIRTHVDTLLLLGQLDAAVHILLDTDSSDADYYVDALKACLLSSVNESAQCQSTIKLVATNLIALGKIQDGVQLLCVIDKAIDACRYLQANGMWEKATWLAKVSLPESQYSELMNKWAEKESNSKLKRIQILISIGEWNKVVQLLLTYKMALKAAVLIQILQENKIEIPVSLVQSVYVDYASELVGGGLNLAAKLYTNLAGDITEEIPENLA